MQSVVMVYLDTGKFVNQNYIYYRSSLRTTSIFHM